MYRKYDCDSFRPRMSSSMFLFASHRRIEKVGGVIWNGNLVLISTSGDVIGSLEVLKPRDGCLGIAMKFDRQFGNSEAPVKLQSDVII